MDKTTQIAISMTTFDKYKPGKQKFFLQSLVPTQELTNEVKSTKLSTSNLLNKDTSGLQVGSVDVGSTIELEVPKDVCRWFQVKFIPPGTRFVVGFDNGDITNPRIIGRDFITEQGGYNGDDN